MALPRYAVIDEFLDASLHGRLLDFVLANDAEFVAPEVRFDAGADPPARTRRSLTCRRSLGDLRSAFEQKVLPRFTKLLAATGTPTFPAIACGIELVAHRDGDFFALH
jgi:hypothetical protein